MTATALQLDTTCTCTESDVVTGDLCDLCNAYYCANCGEHPRLDGDLCGGCLDEGKQAAFDLEAGDLAEV